MKNGYMNNFQQVRDRKLAIYALIYLNSDEKNKLNKVMDKIASTGDKRFLTARDKYFSYCKERDVWYGCDSTNLPSKALNHFL